MAGRSYETEQVQFGTGRVRSRELIEGFAKEYPVGSRPTVYYDPEDPQEAVLERTDEVATNNRGLVWVTFIVPPMAALIALLRIGSY